MRLKPEDPMRTRATDAGVEDGWRGARIGAERRDAERRAATRIPAEIDLGEPEPPWVVIAFLALTVLVSLRGFAMYGMSPTVSELARAGGSSIGAVATGGWWKLLVANLLHANVPHLLMNAFVIYLTGRWLEHLAGRMLVVATILWSMLLASAGSLVLDAASVTIGASGVAFGLVGCAFALDPRARTAVGTIARSLLIVNIVITFIVPGISIGGHLGGLAAGLFVGWIGWRRGADEGSPVGAPRAGVVVALLAVAAVATVLLAVGPRWLPNEAADARGRVVAPLLARQLSGSDLSSGRSIDEATCSPTDDPTVYACDVDGDLARAEFDLRDDQWSLAIASG